MASLYTVNPAQDLASIFSFKNMKTLMDFLNTRVSEETTLAIDANANDIQNAADCAAILNGQPIFLADDAALDISASTEETAAWKVTYAWATGQSYSAGDIYFNGGVRYRCIETHTSRDNTSDLYIANEPGVSDIWTRYWEVRPHDAVNASGTSIADDYDQWFLVTSTGSSGTVATLQMWEAGDEGTIGAAECKVPLFDPKTYIPIGFIHVVNETAAAFVVGTTDFDAATGDGVTTTFLDLVGPLFPHADNWPSS